MLYLFLYKFTERRVQMKKFLFFISLVGLLQAQGITGSGDVLVNGVAVNKNTKIKYGDTIEVKANSKVKFNVGKDVFFAKSNTKFKLDTLGSKKNLKCNKWWSYGCFWQR